MRNRRQIKKLSKALAPFFKDVWRAIDDEEIAYHGELLPNTSAKGILHVGGGTDYWGEGEDAYTVLEVAEQAYWGWQSFCGCEICQDSFDPASTEVCDISQQRLKQPTTFKNIYAAIASGQA